MGSNSAEKTIKSTDATDPTGLLSPYSYTPSWPQDMVINNCKPYKGDNEKHKWSEGEHSQDDFNAAVNLDKVSSGGNYCTIM